MTTIASTRHHLPIIALLVAGICTAPAAEQDIRLVPQLAFGTSGLEPGIALEVRTGRIQPLIVRPEVLLNEDGRLGVGAALLFDISSATRLSERQALAIGPRLVYHHADESGWEADAMATWGIDLSGRLAWRHSVGVLAAIGALHDPEDDDTGIGLTGGIYYAYHL